MLIDNKCYKKKSRRKKARITYAEWEDAVPNLEWSRFASLAKLSLSKDLKERGR